MSDDTSTNDNNDDENTNAQSDEEIEDDDNEVQSQVESIKSLSIPASNSLPVPSSVPQSIPVPSVVHPSVSTPITSNIVPPLTVNSVQRSIPIHMRN